MSDVLQELRSACAEVARRARYVRIDQAAVPSYAAALTCELPPAEAEPDVHLAEGDPETRASFWITLDAINFGSGWFPTLRKPYGRSGYYTIAAGISERFATRGPWSAEELAAIERHQVAEVLHQDPEHELMERFAQSLRDLGGHLEHEHAGSFAALIDDVRGSAPALVARLGEWECFADSSSYDELRVPFLKRAQITAADLERAGIERFPDLDRLTMFADNLVAHVLRLDGILHFDPALVRRIERGELFLHGSVEEVEIRACALHAVELVVAELPAARAADIDQRLWLRGQGAHYKARPRHRCRCTAY